MHTVVTMSSPKRSLNASGDPNCFTNNNTAPTYTVCDIGNYNCDPSSIEEMCMEPTKKKYNLLEVFDQNDVSTNSIALEGCRQTQQDMLSVSARDTDSHFEVTANDTTNENFFGDDDLEPIKIDSFLPQSSLLDTNSKPKMYHQQNIDDREEKHASAMFQASAMQYSQDNREELLEWNKTMRET